MTAAADFILQRPPQTDEELYELIWTLWNVRIPNTPVCTDHCTPFQAVADAFFARHPVSVWVGSRGFGGKSRSLAYLALTEAVVLGAEVNLLGGSFEQSRNVHEAMRDGWDAPLAPRYLVAHLGAQLLRLTNGAKVRPLTASQRTVRGPHPQRLRLDEIDEMDITILDAAMGQPMPDKGIETQTVMSSTWQYPDKTMTEIVRRAEENGWPVMKWCVASGSLVTTTRGEIPIEEILTTDRVLTRKGWRQVQHVTFMGYKPTISLQINGRTLRLTPDHRIATPDGWREASALAADTMTSTGSDPSVLGCELVSFAAMSSSGLIPVGARSVGGVSNDLQMNDIDTGSIPTDVIESHSLRNGTNNVLVDPSMRLDDAVSAFGLLNPIAITTTARPVDAVGVHGDMLTPVWDIGVDGEHEFIAEGVVVHNCYKETSNPIDGWLAPTTIERKKLEVSNQMFMVEYDLQEPSVGNRAFDTAAIEKMFSGTDATQGYVYKTQSRRDVEDYEFEQPKYEGEYITAADWAKEVDRTVISTWRIDCKPWRLVAYYRGNRMPYPVMVAKFDKTMEKYGGRGIHDATGLGGVVADYLESRSKVKGFLMTGRARDDMLSEYVAAVERGEFQCPKVETSYTAHKYASVESLYGRGNDTHLPDEVCSFALAWALHHGIRSKVKPIIDVTKEDGSYWKSSEVSTPAFVL